MIKLVVTGLWIVAVTLGSVYATLNFTSAKPEIDEAKDFFGGLDYVRTDMLSIPAFAGGQVGGYFITRLVYTADPNELKTLTLPPQLLITDELYTQLVGNAVIDFTNMDTFDTDAFRETVRDRLNERLGRRIFHDVLIEQIEFVTKSEIRNEAARRRLRPATPRAEDPPKATDQ